MNEFGKYRLFRKYVSSDGVNYTPLDEYQALLVENNSCQCGYRELEYRFDGEYKEDAFYKYEIWNEYSFCPTDSSYDELTGNVDYRNTIPNECVMIATYRGDGSNSVEFYNYSPVTGFYDSIMVNKTDVFTRLSGYIFNNTDINEVAFLNVTIIDEMCFRYCTMLTSINIPDCVTNIRGYAFDGCTSLTSVTIGNGLGAISANAFANCISLTSITIGSRIRLIYYDAFENCKSLKSITCYATTAPELWNNTLFQYLPTNGTLYVPQGSNYSSWLSRLPSGWTIEYI